MMMVWLTAIGVGGATMVGAVLGFVFRHTVQKIGNMVLSFASGVMLAAAVLGLILPALDHGGAHSTLVAVAGILTGAVGLKWMHRLIPHLSRMLGTSPSEQNLHMDRVLLFTAAIAIHNLPEGIAAGVGFGTGSTADALMIAGGIALQNLPEGMVIIAPMLEAGIPPGRTLWLALATGAVEIVGTLLGYFTVQAASAILPFALAFAGGTMLYVISDEMIPEIHTDGGQGASFTLLLGFCLMLVIR
ncbi:MAG: ZIP family metal transporter [Clostridia bacterium]|nr:ZIP family metal transporter [Clostridia bacterium]